MLCDVMNVRDKIESLSVRMSHDGGSKWGPQSRRGVKMADVRSNGLQFGGRESVVPWSFSPSAAKVTYDTPRAVCTRAPGSNFSQTPTSNQGPSWVEGEGTSYVTLHDLYESSGSKVLRLESRVLSSKSLRSRVCCYGEIANNTDGEKEKREISPDGPTNRHTKAWIL